MKERKFGLRGPAGTVLALAYFRSSKLEKAVVTQRQALGRDGHSSDCNSQNSLLHRPESWCSWSQRWSSNASNGRRKGAGSKRRNDGGATFSGPSAAASTLRVLGSRSGHLPLFSR